MTSSDRQERRFLTFLGVSSAWALAILAMPADLRGTLYVLGAVATLVIVFRRAGQLAGEVRLPIVLVTLAGTTSLIGVVVRFAYGMAVGEDFPFPSPGDVFALASYPLVTAAVLAVVYRRLGRFDSDLALDALVAGAAAAILQWSLIVAPYVQDTSFSSFAHSTQIVYSVLGLLLLMAAVMTLVAGSHRSTSNRLLAAALVATFFSDNFGTYLTANRMDEALLLLVAPLIYVFGGSGVLHPSVELLTSRPVDLGTMRSITAKRIVVMAAALVGPPALLLWFTVTEAYDRLLLPAAGSLALAPLVVIRLGRLVKDRERLVAQEASLRTVGERLVGAETTEDVARVISVGAEQLLGPSFERGGLLLDAFSDVARRATDDELLPALDAVELQLLSVDHPITGSLFDLPTTGPGRVLAGLVVVKREVRGVLLMSLSDDLTVEQRLAVTTLCREASIALRAVEQTEINVRQRSEERFASLVDNSSDIVLVIADDGTIDYVSPVALRLLGYTQDSIPDRGVLDFVHPDDRPAALRLLDTVRFGGHEAAELRLRHIAGTYHWFEVVGVDLASDPNIRGIVFNAREIGDRKAAEERLQLSEARFKALVQHSSDVVVVVDTHHRLRYVSPSATATLGEDPDSLQSRPLDTVFRSSGVDWGNVLTGVHTRSDQSPELLEFAFRNARGDWLTFETAITDLRAEPAVGGWVLNARDVTERKAMMQRLRYQATHDELTGLANRVLVVDELSGMLGRNGGSSTVAALFIDLDDFKDVNDSLGHTFGDRLLLAVAERLKGLLTFGDVAGRIGGDEFVVALERSHGEDRIVELAEQLLLALEQPYEIDGRELTITASAGLAFDHDRGTSGEVLLRNADTAMYRAKQLGKRRVMVFESHMRTASFDRLELRADMVRAIETDQFMAYYQPIVDLQSRRLLGAEALIRWEHPHRGLLSPAIFVPLAEETGLIGELGRWMMRRGCRDLATWRAEMPEAAEQLTISVNLSVQEMQDRRLVPSVQEVLAETGIPADRLVLEVTETDLMTDTDAIRAQMDAIRALGVRLAVDDFGTGYSSLGYIQRFDFDVLKIDRSFVEGLQHTTNQRIVTAVLDLAHELGVTVVAEGIEQEEQERLLLELGCGRGQGFLYSRPVPAMDFRKLLGSERVRLA